MPHLQGVVEERSFEYHRPQYVSRRPRIATNFEKKTTIHHLSWRRPRGDASRRTQTAASRETAAGTNFVMWIEIPSNREDGVNNDGKIDQLEWAKGGVAAFCSLKF